MNRLSLIVVAGCIVGAGCTEGSTSALDISFFVDSNVHDPGRLRGALSSIKLSVDAPTSGSEAQGLYPQGTEYARDNVRVDDIDGDGWPELIATIDASKMDSLPRVRLERGGMADLPLQLRVTGTARTIPGEIYAEGSQSNVRFTMGQVKELVLPFQISPAYLPPRVTQQLASRTSALLFFSKQMDRGSLLSWGVVRVVKIEGGEEVLARAEEINVTTIAGPRPSTGVEYVFAEPLQACTDNPPQCYRVRITTRAVDASEQRTPLDQVPGTPGNQPYSWTFAIAADNVSGAKETDATNDARISRPEDFRSDAGIVGSDTASKPLGNFVADANVEAASDGAARTPSDDERTPCPSGAQADAQGNCLPEACPTCDPGLVCDPTFNLCVLDCRPYGGLAGCPPKEPICDTRTGLCGK